LGLFRKRRKKFGEILIEKGYASREEVEAALREQREISELKGIEKTIGDILYEKGIIDVEQIEEALEAQKRSDSFFLKSLTYWMFHSK
jgi:hypothetical protein